MRPSFETRAVARPKGVHARLSTGYGRAEMRLRPAPQDEERSRTYARLSAGITSLANQMSCSLNSLGGTPSAQWIMKFSSPGYLSATDLMPSMTCAGGPQNQ